MAKQNLSSTEFWIMLILCLTCIKYVLLPKLLILNILWQQEQTTHSNLKRTEYSDTMPAGHFLVCMIYDYNLKQKMHKTLISEAAW